MNMKCFYKSRQNDIPYYFQSSKFKLCGSHRLSLLTLFEKSRIIKKNCITDNPNIYRQRQGRGHYRKMIGKEQLAVTDDQKQPKRCPKGGSRIGDSRGEKETDTRRRWSVG